MAIPSTDQGAGITHIQSWGSYRNIGIYGYMYIHTYMRQRLPAHASQVLKVLALHYIIITVLIQLHYLVT